MEYSPEEKEKLKQFRSRVSQILSTEYQSSDAYLISWLRARQLNLDKAEEMLRKSLEWRKLNGVDGIIGKEEIPEKYKGMIPFAYCGNDAKSGCPVFLFLMGRHDMRSLLETEGIEVCKRWNIIFMEMVVEIMKDLSKKRGHPVTQFIEVIDLEGYSYRQMSSKLCRDFMLDSQKVCDANYPEIIKHITMINAPKIFSVLYNVMKPLIPKETLAKIDIQGPDAEKWKQVLMDKYPMDLIPKHWGGTLEGSDEYCSQSDIWIFGPLNYDKFFASDQEDFIKAKIKPRDKLQVPFEFSPVEHQDLKCRNLTWEFKIEDYDIGFGIVHNDKVMLPIQRTKSGEEGVLECKRPGKYIAVFDNSYSYTRGKTVYYKIKFS